jgi:hypothetical protein
MRLEAMLRTEWLAVHSDLRGAQLGEWSEPIAVSERGG